MASWKKITGMGRIMPKISIGVKGSDLLGFKRDDIIPSWGGTHKASSPWRSSRRRRRRAW